MNINSFRFFVLTILVCGQFYYSYAGSTYYASPDGLSTAACTIDDPGTLDLAVSKAVGATSITNGDTVILLSGIYWKTNATINLNKKYLTIKGATSNPSDTVLHGIGSTKPMRLFYSTQYATIENLTITNYCGSYEYFSSSVIYSKPKNSATCPRLNNCIIAGCYDEKSNYGARPVANGGVFTRCLFVANRCTSRAPQMGGAFIQLYDCVFRGNYGNTIIGRGSDGEAYNSIIVSNCVFDANKVPAMSCGGKVFDCIFTNNVAASWDGIVNAALLLAVNNSFFYGNESLRGGCTYGGNIRATNCQFINNKSADSKVSYDYGGGAAYNGIYSNCLFRGNYIRTSNRSWYGGAIRGGRAVGCVFDGNRAGDGGATYGTMTINCLFTNNTASTLGSAAYGGSHTNSFYVNNKYTGSNTSGGILYGGVFDGCAFSENSSARYLGYNSKMENSLIVSNTITASGYSIAANGIYVNSTITGNKTVNKAAITGGTYTNTIVIANDNSQADVGGGTHIHTLYNTFTGTPSFDEGSIKTASARFCGNGTKKSGPWSIKASSPARDAGIAVDLFNESSVDIYGNPRIYKTIDIGCSEFIPFSGMVLMVK